MNFYLLENSLKNVGNQTVNVPHWLPY